MGSVTLKQGDLFPHIHITAAAPDCSLVGGHLNACVISGTCEMFLHKAKIPIDRFAVSDRPGVYWFDLD